MLRDTDLVHLLADIVDRGGWLQIRPPGIRRDERVEVELADRSGAIITFGADSIEDAIRQAAGAAETHLPR